MASNASSSRHNDPISSAFNYNQYADPESTDADVSELDDYFYALFVQALLISSDRETGKLGKFAADSDPQIAIEHMLQEAQEMEQSYRLAKSLSTCGSAPDYLLEEMSLQDSVTRDDRELAERIGRGESSAEISLRATTERFQLVLQHFNTTADCCACSSNERTYIAPCGHAYCDGCARSLYSHALTNRAFIPVRCCKEPFASEVVAACLANVDDINKYESIKREIENPCPPASELDAAASRLISENCWK
ncbi:hypothetical protein BGZ51_007311 [Haplosporangium sp. Z 767]|nr:hypothetical protein BGZ50_005734 [Haplosporangium sp. Z 11]KAF9191455.1 hypothetical protein BGZ51_007311 [Haplosporangium sp. Z 767]